VAGGTAGDGPRHRPHTGGAGRQSARQADAGLAWAGIALVNLSAMTLFLWHQTAFLTVSSAGLLVGRVPGLLTAPTGGLWVAERLAWLPVFAIMLSGLWLVFRRVETPS
jgi:hypothetical protein